MFVLPFIRKGWTELDAQFAIRWACGLCIPSSRGVGIPFAIPDTDVVDSKGWRPLHIPSDQPHPPGMAYIWSRAPRPPPPQWSMVLDRVGPPLPCGVVWVLSCGFSAAPRGFWRPLRSPSLWCGVGSWGWLVLVLLDSWKFAGRAALCALPPLLGVLVGVESVAVWHVVGVLWWS